MKTHTARITAYGRSKNGNPRYIRICLPMKVAKEFGLEDGDLMIVEPDLERGHIVLIPARVVPRNMVKEQITR